MDSLVPMLAVAGEPFDSPDYLFEIKWDGVRTLAAIEPTDKPTGWLAVGEKGSRLHAALPGAFPAAATARRHGPGWGAGAPRRGGAADFESLLSRHQLVSPRKIHQAAAQHPVTYVVFDLLSVAVRKQASLATRSRPVRWRPEPVMRGDGLAAEGLGSRGAGRDPRQRRIGRDR